MGEITVTRDVACYHAAWDALYAVYAAFYKVEQTREMRDRTWNWITEGRIICLMAIDSDGRPVGIAHLREFLRPLASSTAGYLDDRFVDPSSRGSGIVDQLFKAATDLGRERRWSVIRWITREDNSVPARSMTGSPPAPTGSPTT